MQKQFQHTIPTQILDRFCMAGINYHHASIDIRGLFAVNADNFASIAESAKEQQLRSVFVISTCNRTEIYGFAESVLTLVQLLVKASKGDADTFLRHAYLKTGEIALDHLFKVSAGLDSQIIGDYEILGQLKQAVDLASTYGLTGPIMNRTINFVLQASKRIKTETSLSSGTVSVSYAAIELLQRIPEIANKKILMLGAGKFGGNVCRNLKQYLPFASLTLVNRTDETAYMLAKKTGADYLPYELLADGIESADIVIVCTNSQVPTVLPDHFRNRDEKLILDLSVPSNVDSGVKNLAHLRVIDVDDISTRILDQTLTKRKSEIPKAEAIIAFYKTEFHNWLNEYRYSLHIKSWKEKLQELNEWQTQPFCEMTGDEVQINRDKIAQKAVTRLALNLRTNEEKGCQFINAINDYLQMS